MPRNLRPSFYTPGWEDKNWADIQKAQNDWDLLKAQEDLVKEMKKQNAQNSESKYEPKSEEHTYIDYALLAQVDRNKVIEYMNKYNQQVVSETNNINDMVDKERKLNYQLVNNDNNRGVARYTSYSFLILICVIIAVIGLGVLITMFSEALLIIGITIGALILTICVWSTLTEMYITSKYSTKEQDEKNLDKVIDKKVMSSTYKKFREFRIKHYNEYMEHLVNEYTINSIKYYYVGGNDLGKPYIDMIPKSEIIAYGTSEDYMNYFKNNFNE